MSLTTRLSLVFLAMLAGVLIAFSAGLYLLARWSLLSQVDHRLAASLESLVASVEIEPDGVEWNRREHKLALLEADAELEWEVVDDRGNRIDGSRNFPDGLAGATAGGRSAPRTIEGNQAGPWRVTTARVAVPDSPAGSASAIVASIDTPRLPDADADDASPARRQGDD